MIRSYEILSRYHKLFNTLRIVATLFMARTFGEYLHSAYDGQFEYAKYRWRDQVWAIPTESIKGEPGVFG